MVTMDVAIDKILFNNIETNIEYVTPKHVAMSP